MTKEWIKGGVTKWRNRALRKKFSFAVQNKKLRYHAGFVLVLTRDTRSKVNVLDA